MSLDALLDLSSASLFVYIIISEKPSEWSGEWIFINFYAAEVLLFL